MGSVRKFSEIDWVIKETQAQGCIGDTSALIAFTYYASEFEDDADFLFKRLAKYKLPIYVNVSVRHEYVDFERRIHLTEFLMSLPKRREIASLLPSPFKALIGKYKKIIDDRAECHELPLLTEREIKAFKREALKHRHPPGDLWTVICHNALAGKLEAVWESTLSKGGIGYVSLDPLPSFMKSKPQWNGVYSLIEGTGLGGADAMILNFLECSKLPFALSCDFDFAYAAYRGSVSKTILIPDELYRRRMKPLMASPQRKPFYQR